MTVTSIYSESGTSVPTPGSDTVNVLLYGGSDEPDKTTKTAVLYDFGVPSGWLLKD